MNYPIDDEFKEHTITEVKQETGGSWSVTFDDGWSFFVPKESPVKPTVGIRARLYGKGTSHRVRGLFLDGQEVFYRSAEQDDAKFEVELYGDSAAEWLRRWDANETVWTIEMGGLGPGYEQAIQITTAELLRHLLAEKYDVSEWEDESKWKRDRAKIDSFSSKDSTIVDLGLSGAQRGAAMNLAAQIYRRGPIAVMKDEAVKDRHIQVQKEFPQSRRVLEPA